MLAVLDYRVTREATWHWRKGRNPLPAWAAGALADAIQARVDLELALLAELRDHAELMERRQRKPAGFARLSPDGRDKRGRKAADPENL